MKNHTIKNLFNGEGKLTLELLKPSQIQQVLPREEILLPTELNYHEALVRLSGDVQADDLDHQVVSFIGRARGLVNELTKDYRTDKVLVNRYFPIFLGQEKITDLGVSTKLSIEAFVKRYRAFTNKHINRGSGPSFCTTAFRYKQLEKKVKTSKGSHYKKLVDKREQAAVVALYIPGALQANSPETLAALMRLLPRGFALASPREAAVVMTMYMEDLIGKEKYSTHIFNCAATVYTRYKQRTFAVSLHSQRFYFGGSDIQTKHAVDSFDLLYFEQT